jgi:flagellar hook protein FlgE
MLRSLNSGVSAMQQFQGRLDVIGNNIANVNTTGFKSARMEFSDAFSQTLHAAGPGVATQIGSGVNTAAISNQFTQGVITTTGTTSDLAITGDGFFVVRNATTGGQFYTRAGDFQLDQNGYLVTVEGYRVQGYSDSGLTTLGDIRIDTTGSTSTAEWKNFSFSSNGTLTVTQADGNQFVRGQVLLQKFNNPQGLIKEGGNLFSASAAAGPLAALAVPGAGGTGAIQGGALETSNVDLAGQFADLITTQRAFQASARIITTSDEVLQELVNLKR